LKSGIHPSGTRKATPPKAMRELGKYFRMYCNETHKKWLELVPHIEKWLNSSVCTTIGYAPIELLNGETRPDLFKKLLNFEPDSERTEDSLPNKLLKAYAKMKLKAEKRNRKKIVKTKWEPKQNDLVLIKCQLASDAAQGVISKFQRPYEGPFLIREMISTNMYNVCDDQGKPRGLFHLGYLKPYLRTGD
jgi:hypothetical protein